MPRMQRGSALTLRALAAATIAALAVLVPVAPARAAELLMFEQAGCPWCQRWHAEVGVAYPKTREGRRAPLRRVDITEAGRSGVALSAPVNASPTFVLVDNGREVGRITGYPGADFFWGMLEQMLARLGPADPPSPARDDRASAQERQRVAAQTRT